MSAIARGPTGLTTVFTGAIAIRAGAILSPCMPSTCQFGAAGHIIIAKMPSMCCMQNGRLVGYDYMKMVHLGSAICALTTIVS